jgi:hypothetical protein
MAFRPDPWPEWTKPTWFEASPEYLTSRERMGRTLCTINGIVFVIMGLARLAWILAEATIPPQ